MCRFSAWKRNAQYPFDTCIIQTSNIGHPVPSEWCMLSPRLVVACPQPWLKYFTKCTRIVKFAANLKQCMLNISCMFRQSAWILKNMDYLISMRISTLENHLSIYNYLHCTLSVFRMIAKREWVHSLIREPLNLKTIRKTKIYIM